MSKKCTNCGSLMRDNLNFCTKCGSKLADTTSDGAICQCGATIKPGNFFCTVCGRRVISSEQDRTSHPPQGRSSRPPSRSSAGTVMVCPQCGNALKPGLKFCTKCGAKLADDTPTPPPAPTAVDQVRCPHCEAMVKSGNRFCTKCGRELLGGSSRFDGRKDERENQSKHEYTPGPLHFSGEMKHNGEDSMYKFFQAPTFDLNNLNSDVNAAPPLDQAFTTPHQQSLSSAPEPISVQKADYEPEPSCEQETSVKLESVFDKEEPYKKSEPVPTEEPEITSTSVSLQESLNESNPCPEPNLGCEPEPVFESGLSSEHGLDIE